MSLSDVVKYCKTQLNKKAQQYLESRGVSLESSLDFELGHCPFEIEGLLSCTDPDELIKYQLVFRNKDEYKSFIRNSIVFPLVNQYGQIVSISFRPMQSNQIIKDKNLRKYWHISFEKGLFLYGLKKAIPAIRESGQVIVGEGQFDVIMAHQHNIKNVVGVMGTSLSTKQMSILSRYASEIIAIFDGDSAGQNALQKLKNKKIPSDIVIKTATLPAGEDVDSFLRKFGREEFLKLIMQAI